MHTEHPGTTPAQTSRGVDRKQFLKISGAGLFGSLFIGALGSSRAFAQSRGEPEESLMQEFREAAEEYGVPVGLLSAMGYVNTRWEMPSPEASDYEEGELHGLGIFGIMALTQNPSSDTLGEAAELTGISEEELKGDRAANIKGGAALLAASQGDNKPREVGEWFRALTGEGRPSRGARDVDSTSGVGGGELYAEQVFATLKSGARKKTRRGEEMALQAQQLSEDLEKRLANAPGGEDDG